MLRTSPILGPDRTQRFLYGIIFRSARLGRCSTRQLRDHRSRAAQESTRWGCEPQTLGPISQRQGFYKDRLLGESTPLPHESVGVLIRVRRKLMRKSTWPSPRRAPGCQQLRRRELRSEFPRGVGGGSSRGAGLSINSTAPQLRSSTCKKRRGYLPGTHLLGVCPRDQGMWPGPLTTPCDVRRAISQ